MGYWFRPKRYGYGAAPANWKGWAAVAVFIALMALLQAAFQPVRTLQDAAMLLAVTMLALVVFAVIAWKKTEGGWRWRWGSKD